MSKIRKQTTVIIVGAGPTGVVLATLLGKKNISTILVEKEGEVFPVTRATHLDVETIRNFQMTGLIHELLTFTECVTHFDVLDKTGKKLFEQTLTHQDSIHYYKEDRFFDQVAFEQILRKGLARYPSIELITDAEAIEVKAHQDEVKVVVKDNKRGENIEVRGEWLVGCDGGNSFVRESFFPKMKQLKAPKDWILVDTILNKPEYANVLPDRFRYYLSDDRLAANAHGFGLNRRWEFETKKGEDMPEEAVIQSWITRFISLDKITFKRIKQYTHRALIAPVWKKDRIFLAGDAAHLMPPFAGQGLCSGVRDAINLAWKLAEVVHNKGTLALLDSYDTERRAQIKHTFAQTHLLKEILEAETHLQKWRRKLLLQSIELLPTKIRTFMQKSFSNPKPLAVGCIDTSSKLSGMHLPQLQSDNEMLSDDKIGYEWVLIFRPTRFKNPNIALNDIDIPLGDFQGVWEEWLTKNKVDFVIVRPDKIIFGAGKAQNLKHVYEAYKKWVITT